MTGDEVVQIPIFNYPANERVLKFAAFDRDEKQGNKYF